MYFPHHFKQQVAFHWDRFVECEECSVKHNWRRLLNVSLQSYLFHLKLTSNMFSVCSCRVWTRGTLLTSLLPRLSVSSPCSGPPGRVPQTFRTCYCGALSLAQIHAWHSAAILPAINLTFLHRQGLHILTMTDTLRWKRLPEPVLLLLLLEDLAELPGSTWRVRRKEQRGGWHQSCQGHLSEDNWAFDTEQRAAGESTRV